jgi:magnesium chelatase family protein
MVVQARALQAERLAGTGWSLNRDIPGTALRQGRLALPKGRTRELDNDLDRGLLTLRGYDRCLRVAWTIRDLRGGGAPTAADVGEALALRGSGRAAA